MKPSTQPFDIRQFQEDVDNILSTINTQGEGEYFLNLKSDLLNMAFTEFIASKKFAELDSERRRDLFQQYELLNWFLEQLEEFVEKYPNPLEITSLEVKPL